MKVGYLTTELSTKHGWGRYSIEIIKGMLKRGIKVLVLSSANSRDNELPEVTNYPILTPLFSGARLTSLRILGNFFKVRELVSSCDLVHCMAEPYAPLTAIASKGKPYIISGVGTYAVEPLNHLIKGAVLRYVYRKAAKIVCISRFTEGQILRKVKLNNTVVIPLGVDYDAYQRPVCRSGEDRIVLSVGAVKPRKGYDVSIEAVAKVKEATPNIEYFIIGDTTTSPGFFAYLQGLVERYNLQDTVHFLGEVSDQGLIKWYHRCDLFLLTPVNVGDAFEGFGLVYLEANACGKPVIGTLNCGAEEAIIDGYNGFLVPQRDSDATAEVIRFLLTNPRVAEEIGDNGRKRAKEMSWDNTVSNITSIYNEVLEEPNAQH